MYFFIKKCKIGQNENVTTLPLNDLSPLAMYFLPKKKTNVKFQIFPWEDFLANFWKTKKLFSITTSTPSDGPQRPTKKQMSKKQNKQDYSMIGSPGKKVIGRK